jgi:MFS family permease
MIQTNKSFFRYENGILLMMFFTFGFVFMERLSVVFLFPYIAPDLKLSNAQIGMIVSILSITWAISGSVFGGLSDIIGSKRKVLLPITLLFSALSFVSGMVNNFVSMVIVRGLMGLSEGPVLPIAQACVIAASSPERRGFNSGFMQSSIGLIGSTFTPIIVTTIAASYSWHSAFYLVGIPGIIMFFILSKYMREPGKVSDPTHSHKKLTRAEYSEVYKNRNVWLCTIMSGFFMTWLFVFTTFAPEYLTQVDKYTGPQMGLIMAAIGFGSFVWGFVAPWISDKIGRKPTLIIFCIVACLAPLSLAVVHASIPVMMVLGFFTSVGQGCFPLFMAIIPGESLPGHLVASAVALTQLIGELVGGTVAPSLAGFAADQFGLSAPLWIACAGALVSGLLGFGLKETAPKHSNSYTVDMSIAKETIYKETRYSETVITS